MSDDWGFYEVTIGVIALIFTLVGAGWALFERYKNRKDLRYRNYESVSLVTDRSSAENIQIIVGGNLVDNPHLTSFEVMNIGRMTIVPDDFIEPLKIYLSDNTKIFSANVSTAHPAGLNPSLDYDKNCIKVNPLLMNGGDSFKISVITEKPVKNHKITARIVGVSTIKKVNPRTNQWMLYLLLLVIGLLLPLLVNQASSAIELLLTRPGVFFSVTEYAIKHNREYFGDVLSETISFVDNPAFDNTQGSAPLQINVEVERNYQNFIVINRAVCIMVSTQSGQDVRDLSERKTMHVIHDHSDLNGQNTQAQEGSYLH